MRPSPFTAPRHGRPARQRGMVTAVVVLFLISTVVFALSQMLNISGNNVIDGQRQGDSTAAFFLAESGLDKAQAKLAARLVGTVNQDSCLGVPVAASSPYALGRGSVSLAASSPTSTCSGSACTQCTLTAVGRVGVSTRTVERQVALTTVNGTFCNGANGCSNTPTVTWQLNLQNTSGVAGIGIFTLSYDGQGNNRATCAAGSNCRLQLDLSSPSAGQNSVGQMGNAVLIPAGATYPIYQTMTQGGNSLAEVGTFFLGTTAPVLTGPYTIVSAILTPDLGGASYWEGRNNQTATKTVGNNNGATNTSGGTNDGTLTAPVSGTCSAPSANNQTCTSWCYAGDTLVYSFAGNTTLVTDALSSVSFGTNANNVAMTRVSKYPNPLVIGSPSNVDAEIWYARNPNLSAASGSPSPLAVNASSYKGRGSGSIGARWTSNAADTTAISGTTLTVGASFGTAYPNQIISVGDTVSNAGGTGSPTCTANCGTIVSQLTSTETGGMTTGRGGRGTYQVSGTQTVAAVNNRQWTINSNVLHVTACTMCNLATGDALTGLVSGRTISSQSAVSPTYAPTETLGGVGRYVISGAATWVTLGTNLYAGTPGPTLYLPSTSIATPVWSPTANALTMMLAVKSGTGAFASGTTVSAASTAPNAATTAFTLSATPTTPLDLATICAGTCAFFVPNGITAFSLGGITANFNGWASGFTCLKGVNLTPQVVTSSSSASNRWTEVVY
jgi:hypothetical protein